MLAPMEVKVGTHLGTWVPLNDISDHAIHGYLGFKSENSEIPCQV